MFFLTHTYRTSWKDVTKIFTLPMMHPTHDDPKVSSLMTTFWNITTSTEFSKSVLGLISLLSVGTLKRKASRKYSYIYCTTEQIPRVIRMPFIRQENNTKENEVKQGPNLLLSNSITRLSKQQLHIIVLPRFQKKPPV